MHQQKIYIQSGKRTINVTADTKAKITIEQILGEWSAILQVDEEEITLFRVVDEIVHGVKMSQAISDLQTIRTASDMCHEADRYGTE